MARPEETLIDRLVASMVELDVVEYERYTDLDFSMRKGAGYLRQLALAITDGNSLEEAIEQWLWRVRHQVIWRYVYEWLSWQPAASDVQEQEAAVEALRDRLVVGDLGATRAALESFREIVRRFPCPIEKQVEVERGFEEAVTHLEQRWEPLEAYRLQLQQLLRAYSSRALTETLNRTQLLANWVVLHQIMQEKGVRFSMPQPANGPPDAPLFARRVMEVLDAAYQLPPAGRLHSAAHEFEKQPRLLAKLLANAEGPLEAIDLWFAKLLREDEIRYTTLARLYLAFDEFRRFAATIEERAGRRELDRLIRYLGNSAIFFAFQYAFERDRTAQLRRQIGERLDLKDETALLAQLTDALAVLYEHGDSSGVGLSLERLLGTDWQSLDETLRATAGSLLPKDDQNNANLLDARARTLLEQSLRLAIYRPAALRTPAIGESNGPPGSPDVAEEEEEGLTI